MLNKYITTIGIISVVIATVNARLYFVKDDTQTAVRDIKKLLGRETSTEDTSIEEYSRNKKRIKITLQPNPNKSEFARKLLNAIKVYYTHLNGGKDQGTHGKICERHFGSLYGTKFQKDKCIQEYLDEKLAVSKESEGNNSKYHDETRTVNTKSNKESLKVNDNDRRNVMVMIIKGAQPFRKNDFKQDKFALDYYDDTRKFINTGLLDDIDYHDDDKIHAYILRSRTDSEDSSATEDSEEESSDEKEKDVMRNRFNIVDNFETQKQKNSKTKYIQYQESSSVESFETTPKPKKNKKQRVKDNEFLYMQGPQRILQSGSDSSYEDAPQNRKYNDRLPHFMPKRYFWHEDDFDKLGYFWFDGAQGLVPHAGARS